MLLYRFLKILQIDDIIKIDNQLTGEIDDIIMKYYDEIKRSIEYYGRTYVEYTIDTDDISKLKPYMDLKGITEFPHMNKTVTRIQDVPLISELSIAVPE